VGERDNERNEVRVPPWEWAFGIAGFLLVAATVVFLGYKALADSESPPDIAVRAEPVVAVEGGFLIRISAANKGDTAAANVNVQGELRSATDTIETSEMTFQYLPARSERTGGLFFANDPRGLTFVVRARGYEKP
jgi:uncharacterized protein (TIGR02588 family)